MHSSGSMTRMVGPSRKQSTGHTSTQSVYLHLMQDSVTTYVMKSLSKSMNRRGKVDYFTTCVFGSQPDAFPPNPVLVYDYTHTRLPVHPCITLPSDIP